MNGKVAMRRLGLALGLVLSLALVACEGDGGLGLGLDTKDPGSDTTRPGADLPLPGQDIASTTDNGIPVGTDVPVAPIDGCTPSCPTGYCGSNGCGGTCGCAANETCNEATQRCGGCTPSCTGKVCGDDGCGGTCAPGCATGQRCTAVGQCITEVPEGSTCMDFFTCQSECPAGPNQQQCIVECDTKLTQASRTAKDAFIACQGANCRDCTDIQCAQDCIAEKCQSEYTACLATGALGTGSCNDFYGCVNACPDPATDEAGFGACLDDCITASSPEGYTAAMAIEDCKERTCGSVPAAQQQACLQDAVGDPAKCGTLADACAEFCDPAVQGDCLGCMGFNGCISACTTAQCQQACQERLTQEGYDAYNAIIDCLVANCPNGDIQNCNQSALMGNGGACAAQAAACQDFCSGADCLNCSGLLNCLNGCRDAACASECFASVTREAYDAGWAPFENCLTTECPDLTDTACQQTAQQGPCQDELQACAQMKRLVRTVPPVALQREIRVMPWARPALPK